MLQPFRDRFNANFTPRRLQRPALPPSPKSHAQKSISALLKLPVFSPSLSSTDWLPSASSLPINCSTILHTCKPLSKPYPRSTAFPTRIPSPNFMTVDFGLIRNLDGSLSPRLVEMQAFPSIFGYQDIAAQQYIESFHLEQDLNWAPRRSQSANLLGSSPSSDPRRTRTRERGSARD